MSNSGLNIGLWYKVSTPSRIKEVKILSSERLVENQDPKYRYFEVLTKDHEGHKSYAMNGTFEECQDFILRNFAVDIPVSEGADNLIRQLEDDIELLRRSENKNYKDVSYRIEYLIEYMRHYAGLIRRNTDESKFSMTDYMLREASKAQYHNYMSFEEFIYKNHAEIWDNCRYSGNWISWYKSLPDDDMVIIRVSDREPEYVKGKFDWTDFKEGEDYEDICLDRKGVLFTDPFEATYVSVADSFWDFGQTFSAD